MEEFLTEYDNFNTYYSNVKNRENEIAKLNELFEASNDFDLVKESSLQNNDDMFEKFCPEYQESLNEYNEKYKAIEEKANYSFYFETATEDEEMVNTVHK